MFRILVFLLGIPLLAGCGAANKGELLSEKGVGERSHHRLTSKRRRPVRIMLDAGHGGEDKGTQSLGDPAYQEKDLSLTTTLLVRDYLRRMGYYPMLTRSSDTFVGLDTRVDIAHNQKSELFVSLHYNAAAATEAHGIEVFYYNSASNPDRTEESKGLASRVLEHVIRESQARDRGIKHGNFAVIRETKIPAILVEGGFMTNSEEMAKLASTNYLDQIAWGVAQGIDDYLQSHHSI